MTSPDYPLSTGPLQLIVAEQYRGVVKYTKITTDNIQECSVVPLKVRKVHVKIIFLSFCVINFIHYSFKCCCDNTKYSHFNQAYHIVRTLI